MTTLPRRLPHIGRAEASMAWRVAATCTVPRGRSENPQVSDPGVPLRPGRALGGHDDGDPTW